MESLAFLCPTPLAPLPNLAHLSHLPQFPPPPRLRPPRPRHPPAALKSPRGFGPAPKKTRKIQKRERRPEVDDEEGDEYEDEDDDGGTIPEVVTNRMMRRMGVSIGIPLVLGLLFFPLFYYLKVVAKVDVPSWIPFLVSFFFFGASLLGISYGIVSASWDPLREGSLLGWTEAQRNWPVFWQSLRGKKSLEDDKNAAVRSWKYREGEERLLLSEAKQRSLGGRRRLVGDEKEPGVKGMEERIYDGEEIEF